MVVVFIMAPNGLLPEGGTPQYFKFSKILLAALG